MDDQAFPRVDEDTLAGLALVAPDSLGISADAATDVYAQSNPGWSRRQPVEHVPSPEGSSGTESVFPAIRAVMDMPPVKASGQPVLVLAQPIILSLASADGEAEDCHTWLCTAVHADASAALIVNRELEFGRSEGGESRTVSIPFLPGADGVVDIIVPGGRSMRFTPEVPAWQTSLLVWPWPGPAPERWPDAEAFDESRAYAEAEVAHKQAAYGVEAEPDEHLGLVMMRLALVLACANGLDYEDASNEVKRWITAS